MPDLCFTGARKLARLIRTGKLSATEVMRAFIASHPAISVPAGFSSDTPPLPVGLQIIGRYRDDFGVLQLAHAFEQETQTWKRRPPLA